MIGSTASRVRGPTKKRPPGRRPTRWRKDSARPLARGSAARAGLSASADAARRPAPAPEEALVVSDHRPVAPRATGGQDRRIHLPGVDRLALHQAPGTASIPALDLEL